jgi:hypothetical protein
VPQAYFVVTTHRVSKAGVVGANADAVGTAAENTDDGETENDGETVVAVDEGGAEGVEEVVMLGTWVATQRLEKKRGRLSLRREQELDALGFRWDGWVSSDLGESTRAGAPRAGDMRAAAEASQPRWR